MVFSVLNFWKEW